MAIMTWAGFIGEANKTSIVPSSFSRAIEMEVNMVETIASKEQRALERMDVNVAAYRDFDKPAGEVSLYDAVRIQFQLWGVNDDDARFLVKTWKQR